MASGDDKSPDAAEEWYRYGQLDREDGPAAIEKDGTQLWYKYGSLHRADGPAVIGRHGGRQEFWLYGTPYKTMAGWERAKVRAANLNA